MTTTTTETLLFTPGQQKHFRNWAEALRSGEYTQGQYKLRSAENSFCCLGVLADLHYSDKWGSTFIDNGQEIKLYRETSKGLPSVIGERLGLISEMEETFYRMNDSLRYTFDQIANEIDNLIQHGAFTEKLKKDWKTYGEIENPLTI